MGGELTPAKPKTPKTPDDYDLAVDQQAEKYLELKQRLTYFLITASSTITAFTVTFVINNVALQTGTIGDRIEFWLVATTAVSGLLTAASALLCLHLEHASHRRHIECRYARMGFDDLSDERKAEWTSINRGAARSLLGAFIFEFVQIASAVTFFAVHFW